MAHTKDGWLVGQNLLTGIKPMSLTQIMALRVLLADESPTIKKVFQLALQDYAVDVTSVGIGLDVVPVARQFKPDIVFCDILLQKRSGYDVCAELKNDQQLKSLPVILMWSSFMELDQDKTQAARADGNLQKPFEVQDLRQIVNQFVAKTRQQRLGNFLNFPKMPEMVEAPAEMPSPTNKDWSMDSFDPIPSTPILDENVEGFQEVPLPPSPKADELTELETEHDATQWSTKALGRFQVQPATDNEMAISFPDEEVVEVGLDLERDEAQVRPPVPTPPMAQTAEPSSPMTEAQIEKMVREQAKSLIEAIVWKVVPDLATQIIERELSRLLADKNP